jgi:hypothetical protein
VIPSLFAVLVAGRESGRIGEISNLSVEEDPLRIPGL